MMDEPIYIEDEHPYSGLLEEEQRVDDKSTKRAMLEAAILAYGYQPTTAEMDDADITSQDVALLFQARGRMCDHDHH